MVQFHPSPPFHPITCEVLQWAFHARDLPGAETFEPRSAQRTARLFVLGFELADHSLGLVVEGGEDLVGVLFRVVKSQAADREIDDFMTVLRSRPA